MRLTINISAIYAAMLIASMHKKFEFSKFKIFKEKEYVNGKTVYCMEEKDFINLYNTFSENCSKTIPNVLLSGYFGCVSNNGIFEFPGSEGESQGYKKIKVIEYLFTETGFFMLFDGEIRPFQISWKDGDLFRTLFSFGLEYVVPISVIEDQCGALEGALMKALRNV